MRTWSSSRGGRELVLRVKVGSGPESWGRSVGFLVRIHSLVCVGVDMLLNGGWRVWPSFCRREDAIYRE